MTLGIVWIVGYVFVAAFLVRNAPAYIEKWEALIAVTLPISWPIVAAWSFIDYLQNGSAE